MSKSSFTAGICESRSTDDESCSLLSPPPGITYRRNLQGLSSMHLNLLDSDVMAYQASVTLLTS